MLLRQGTFIQLYPLRFSRPRDRLDMNVYVETNGQQIEMVSSPSILELHLLGAVVAERLSAMCMDSGGPTAAAGGDTRTNSPHLSPHTLPHIFNPS